MKERISKNCLIKLFTMVFVFAAALCLFRKTDLKAAEVSLNDLTIIGASENGYNSHYVPGKILTAKDGKEYKNAIEFDASFGGWAGYELNEKYECFTGKIVVPDFAGTNGVFTVTIKADDEVIYSKEGITPAKYNQTFSLDIKGKKTLRIETKNDGEFYCGCIAIVDSVFCDKYEISSTKTKYVVEKGEKFDLGTIVKNMGKKMKNPKVTYTVADKDVAKVAANGYSIALSTGETKVTIKAYKKSYTVTILVKPEKVTSLKVKKALKTGLVLKWKAQSGVTGYEIEVWDDDFKEFLPVATVKKATATVKKLESSTSYKFRVRSYLKSGKKIVYGEYSNELTGKTK